MSPKSKKEEIYARHVASRKAISHLSSLGKSLAEIMNPEGKPEVLDDVLVLDASYANFSGVFSRSSVPR
jgi:hypothetical protein